MNFFIDNNLILDFLTEREPFSENANRIFNFAYNNEIVLFAASQSILTSHYVLKKAFPEEKIRKILEQILDFIEVIPADKSMLKKALKSNHKDYEDAVQIFSAHQVRDLTGIITRDIKDFSTSEISVFSPEEALNFIINFHH